MGPEEFAKTTSKLLYGSRRSAPFLLCYPLDLLYYLITDLYSFTLRFLLDRLPLWLQWHPRCASRQRRGAAEQLIGYFVLGV